MEKKGVVLLCDTATEFVRSCTAELSKRGYEVVECEKDGARIEAALAQHKPDIEVLDLLHRKCSKDYVLRLTHIQSPL